MKKCNVSKWRLKQRYEHEIICMCNAYEHPHRLSGGVCTGGAWCTAYRSIDSFVCESCNHNHNNQCDIVNGIEEINATDCECVVDELRTKNIEDTFGYLPLDVEDYYSKLEKQYRS